MSWNLPIPFARKEVIDANHDSIIRFKHNAATGMAEPECTFVTDNPVVMKFINAWINKNPGKVSVDISMQPLKCPYCDFSTEDGTEESVQKFHLHLANHAADLALQQQEEEIGWPEEVNLESLSFADLKAFAEDVVDIDTEALAKERSRAGVIALIHAAADGEEE